MKILIYGRRLCGRVDQVPGVCHVATRFFHLYYVPLIPLSSWIISSGAEKNFDFNRESRIRLNAKSVLFGWVQAYLVVAGMMNVVCGAIPLIRRSNAVSYSLSDEFKLLFGSACLAAWLLFHFRPLQAGMERANQLRVRLGIDPVKQDDDSEWS